MSQFSKFVQIHFDFLYQYGYICLEEGFVDVVSFLGKNNQINIMFSAVEYELTCQFVDGNMKTFSLQDALRYATIKEFQGFYQIPSKREIEKGICYIAEAVKILFEKMDISDTSNFQKVYQFSIDLHKKLLDNYYLEKDIKKAEDYWENKEYAKAKELFEKHISYLSKMQLKKLEYIRKKIYGTINE